MHPIEMQDVQGVLWVLAGSRRAPGSSGLWFVGRTGQPEWVVVRASRVADREAPRPANWLEIAAGCSNLSSTGHFASVALASGEQAFEGAAAPSMPLWRGHELAVVFCGLM